MEYKPTIGLEVHAELKTKTKMFCDSANDPDEKRPNMNVCPVCLAHPGTLPVINREAVRKVIMVGRALGGKIADFTEFDRKNYFYPDLPKGYQISQYKYPIVTGGELNGVQLTRIHLEEDTARSQHSDSGESLVDFNRAGVPLMELVTEPVIESARQAGDFARELQLLLRYLDASQANMEKGQMRVEANVSVRRSDLRGRSDLGTKVEVKNLNSFRAAEQAIEYEVKRQIEVLENGGKVVQETRGWNEDRGETFSQRVKEESHDYRYFPEPDLPKLYLSQVAEFQNIQLPELPDTKRARLARDYGIKSEDIESYVVDQDLGNFFESVAEELTKDRPLVKLASNYITSDLVGLGKLPSVENFVELIKMLGAGEISSRGVKDALKGGTIQKQKSDEGELKKVVEQIIADNPSVVAQYKSGKESSLQFLIGQAMKATRGSANPQILQKLFKEVILFR